MTRYKYFFYKTTRLFDKPVTSFLQQSIWLVLSATIFVTNNVIGWFCTELFWLTAWICRPNQRRNGYIYICNDTLNVWIIYHIILHWSAFFVLWALMYPLNDHIFIHQEEVFIVPRTYHTRFSHNAIYLVYINNAVIPLLLNQKYIQLNILNNNARTSLYRL